MRKLTLALAMAVLVLAGGFGNTVKTASAATYQTKVVIVVGATQGTTASYRADADAAAAEFAKYTTNIVKVYSPNATWSAVQAAARGANILVYLGHGSGFPNPYVGYLQPNGDNGMGLNASAGSSDSNTKYYGENYMAQLGLAPNAVVLLNHLCYASGDNEWGAGKPTLAVAQTRIDGYASGFLRGGAAAVIAEGTSSLYGYIDSLFTSNQTIDQIWRSAPSSHNNYSSWASTRNSGYTSAMDPNTQPASDGDPYYRSMVSRPSTTASSIVGGQIVPLVSQAGKYSAIAPTRMVDTRVSSPGPLGVVYANGPYLFPIAGHGSIPANAIAITANLTVVSAYPGFVYLGPAVYGTPPSSTINFPGGDTRANGVTVALSPDGFVTAYYGGATGRYVNVIIDVTGYFVSGTAGAGFTSFGPQRIQDTRAGAGQVGLSGAFVRATPRQIKVANVAGLPSSGIVAITGNLTITHPNAGGFVYLGPTNPGGASPASSTINFPAGDTRANNVVVQVAADGTLWADYWTGGSAANSVDVILDVSGYFTDSGGVSFHTIDPARILDSRSGAGGILGPLAANTPKAIMVWGAGGVPSGAVAIAANLTDVPIGFPGFASVGPVVTANTQFSNLNFPGGDVRANGVTTPLAGDGTLQLVYGANNGSANLILDVCGYYAP